LISFTILKEVRVRVLREEEEKKKRRREEEEIKQGDHRGFSSGVIPTKVCELLVLGDPFPHMPNSFYFREKMDCVC